MSLPTVSLMPGDILQLDLYWHTAAALTDRYKVFVHVLDSTGKIVAQTDREPGGGLNPTTNWKPDETVIDRYGVVIPPDMSAGVYAVEVGLYGFDDKRLPVSGGGDSLVVAKVEVK